ncbi:MULTISPECIES: STAS domain-containing protein [unclassified Saccharothrix]|uniref:STAS domain-containing protein n=1 Tax=unclassified Saccharothrix TaxID=2593673 RepID=UPI00307ED8D5
MDTVPEAAAGLDLRARARGEVMLLSPAGRLDLTTYVGLRDGLLKHVAEQPAAVVVVLGPALEVGSDTLAGVFGAVWLRCCRWPGVPVVLVATTDRHRRLISRTGLHRFLPCHDRLSTALASIGVPPPRRRDQAVLPADIDASDLARDFTRRTCQTWGGLHEVTARAVLLSAELVVIARRLAGRATTVELRVERTVRQLTLAVRYTDAKPGRRTRGPDLTRLHRLATACGCTPTLDRGDIVWAAVALPESR